MRVDSVGLEKAIEYFKRAPDIATTAARIAINDVASRGALSLARREISMQINFDPSYLKGDRLGVVKKASNADLSAVIRARQRATSLARFAAPGQPLGQNRAVGGVRVRVKKGQSSVMRSAWLVRLRSGKSLTDDNFNVGLAMRLKPGESIPGKKSVHKAWLIPNEVALLYGPSVDQVFRDVAGDIADPVADMVSGEFYRNFIRLSK